MTPITSGDTALTSRLQRQSALLRQQIARHQQELSTGRKADGRLRNPVETAMVSSLERTRGLHAGLMVNARLAGAVLDGQQIALGSISATVQERINELLQPELWRRDDAVTGAAARIELALRDTVTQLNGAVAGRSLFAGVAHDRPALMDVDAMLDTLAGLIPAGADHQTVTQIVADWFADGGGFGDVGYLGGTAPAALIPLGEGQGISLDVTARNPAISEVLAALVPAALLGRGVLDGQPQEQRRLLDATAPALIAGNGAITELQALLGTRQSVVEQATARLTTADAAAEIALQGLRGVDPFLAASELQSGIQALEQHYAVMARLSRLSLAEYL